MKSPTILIIGGIALAYFLLKDNVSALTQNIIDSFQFNFKGMKYSFKNWKLHITPTFEIYNPTKTGGQVTNITTNVYYNNAMVAAGNDAVNITIKPQGRFTYSPTLLVKGTNVVSALISAIANRSFGGFRFGGTLTVAGKELPWSYSPSVTGVYAGGQMGTNNKYI